MLDRVDDLWDLMENAKSLPLSQSCIVPRNEALDLLEDVRASLPAAIQEADEVLRRREDILDDAVRESQAIVASAHEEASTLVDEAMRGAGRIRSDAQHEAEKIIAEARTQAAHMLEHHTITVAARDEALRVLARAQEQASRIVEETQVGIAERLQEVGEALGVAVSEVREGISMLKRAPNPVHVDFDVVSRGESGGSAGDHPFDGRGAVPSGRYEPHAQDAYNDPDAGTPDGDEVIFDLEAEGGLQGGRRAKVYY